MKNSKRLLGCPSRFLLKLQGSNTFWSFQPLSRYFNMGNNINQNPYQRYFFIPIHCNSDSTINYRPKSTWRKELLNLIYHHKSFPNQTISCAEKSPPQVFTFKHHPLKNLHLWMFRPTNQPTNQPTHPTSAGGLTKLTPRPSMLSSSRSKGVMPGPAEAKEFFVGMAFQINGRGLLKIYLKNLGKFMIHVWFIMVNPWKKNWHTSWWVVP